MLADELVGKFVEGGNGRGFACTIPIEYLILVSLVVVIRQIRTRRILRAAICLTKRPTLTQKSVLRLVHQGILSDWFPYSGAIKCNSACDVKAE